MAMKKKPTLPKSDEFDDVTAENPFDALAKHAIDESRKGKTVSLDDYEKKRKNTGKRK